MHVEFAAQLSLNHATAPASVVVALACLASLLFPVGAAILANATAPIVIVRASPSLRYWHWVVDKLPFPPAMVTTKPAIAISNSARHNVKCLAALPASTLYSVLWVGRWLSRQPFPKTFAITKVVLLGLLISHLASLHFFAAIITRKHQVLSFALRFQVASTLARAAFRWLALATPKRFATDRASAVKPSGCRVTSARTKTLCLRGVAIELLAALLAVSTHCSAFHVVTVYR
jgi:hypothetical protein